MNGSTLQRTKTNLFFQLLLLELTSLRALTSNFQGKRNAALVAFFLVTGQQLAGVLSPLSGGCHLLHPSRRWGEQEKIYIK